MVLRKLKMCWHCSQDYATVFSQIAKWGSTAWWAEDSDIVMIVYNAHGKLFSLSDSYWEAIIQGCTEQVTQFGFTKEDVLALCDNETQDRLNGVIETKSNTWNFKDAVTGGGSYSLPATEYADPSASFQAPPSGTGPPAPPPVAKTLLDLPMTTDVKVFASESARRRHVPPFTVWCFGKKKFLPNTAFPKGIGKAPLNLTPSWEKHRCTEVQQKEDALIAVYVDTNFEFKCNACGRTNLKNTSFRTNQTGSGIGLVGPTGVRVCEACWSRYDQAHSGHNMPKGQPTKEDDAEQVRVLSEKGRHELILASTFEQPPQWWELVITQNPDNIYITHTALNAKHQAILEGLDASVTAPTPAAADYEFGDDEERDQLSRILQGTGAQQGSDHHQLQYYAAHIKSQIAEVKADSASQEGGFTISLPPVLLKKPWLLCRNRSASQSSSSTRILFER